MHATLTWRERFERAAIDNRSGEARKLGIKDLNLD